MTWPWPSTRQAAAPRERAWRPHPRPPGDAVVPGQPDRPRTDQGRPGMALDEGSGPVVGQHAGSRPHVGGHFLQAGDLLFHRRVGGRQAPDATATERVVDHEVRCAGRLAVGQQAGASAGCPCESCGGRGEGLRVTREWLRRRPPGTRDCNWWPSGRHGGDQADHHHQRIALARAFIVSQGGRPSAGTTPGSPASLMMPASAAAR